MSKNPLFQIPPGMLALAGEPPGRDKLPPGMLAMSAAQAKLPAPAIDAPEQAARGTVVSPSPGMIILQELRRRQGKPSGPLELAGTEEVQQRPWQREQLSQRSETRLRTGL